jgi:hypothetical protein
MFSFCLDQMITRSCDLFAIDLRIRISNVHLHFLEYFELLFDINVRFSWLRLRLVLQIVFEFSSTHFYKIENQKSQKLIEKANKQNQILESCFLHSYTFKTYKCRL